MGDEKKRQNKTKRAGAGFPTSDLRFTYYRRGGKHDPVLTGFVCLIHTVLRSWQLPAQLHIVNKISAFSVLYGFRAHTCTRGDVCVCVCVQRLSDNASKPSKTTEKMKVREVRSLLQLQ